MTEVIFYTRGLRYSVILSEEKPALIGDDERAAIYLSSQKELLQLELAGETVRYRLGEESGEIRDGLELAGLRFFLLEEEKRVYDLSGRRDFYLSSHTGSQLIADTSARLLFMREGASWRLYRLDGSFYRNNIRESAEDLLLGEGDEICFEQVMVKVYPDELTLTGPVQARSLTQRGSSRYSFYPDYPDYHRSPRRIYWSPEDKVQLNPPPQEPGKPSDELLKLIVPPLLMIGVTVLITLIQPRGIYILATVAMSAASIVFSVRGFFKNRKKYREDKEERIVLYRDYLKHKAIELHTLAKKQSEGLRYHFPDIAELTELVRSYSHRIYEKTDLDMDFLTYRLGLGSVPPSYQLRYGREERSGKRDELEEEGYGLYQRYQELPHLPITTNLRQVPVGYVGPRPLVLEQLQLLVLQLAVFHSYHDLQFVTILPEEEKEEWQWMRWLPHAQLQAVNVRGFVYNQRTRDQVLNSLTQILKLRRAQEEAETRQEHTVFRPHYVILVTQKKLILDHVIMEFFNENPTSLGCSLIFVEDVMSALSENVKTVIQIKDRNSGELVMEGRELRELPFELDHFPAGYDKERLTRTLAPLNHLQNLKSSIPESVSFLEMYGAERVSDLRILQRWRENAPYKSLAVPIGLRGQDDPVYLNLHEKAHGPHGLIAGTTGSGKSETIQSYILSLAVNFHPYDVAFLLIDYKGGGMAHLFEDLPHLLGTITNLDGAQSMRALVSINAELKRRQRLFAQVGVNHINHYQKKYRSGEAAVPMPHLFLISDEFAELKVNQPDFMRELISTARIGRSLGVHLILATQKPTGVVDDQIWSNSRFRIALKVADKGDSNEMLQTHDAAEITVTGRGYLQVGNNEVYELFQSAYSGADYQPDKDDLGIEDHTIYAINELGQYEVLNADLSGLEEANEIKEMATELEAIVSGIRQLADSQHITDLPQPWLPALPYKMVLADLYPEPPVWQEGKQPLEVILGMADIPVQQSQELLTHRFDRDGHLGIYSGPAMGKSTFLQSIGIDLARRNRPDQLHLYLLDFGTNGLLPLAGLPHVADMLYADDEQKIPKLVSRISEEMKRRKALFASYRVGSLEAYERASGESLPFLVFLIDSFEGLKGSKFEELLEWLLTAISRDGASLGLYLVITTGRLNTLRVQMNANIRSKLSFKQADDAEMKTIVGRYNAPIEDKPGRGLIKLEEAEVFQAPVPAEGADAFEMVEHLKAEVKQMAEIWTGERPERIPVVPDVLPAEIFLEMPEVRAAIAKGHLPLGIDFEDVRVKSLPIQDMKHFLLISDRDTVKRIAAKHLMAMVLAAGGGRDLTVFDVTDEYLDLSLDAAHYYNSEADLHQPLGDLREEILAARRDHRQIQRFVLISDLARFVSQSGMDDNDLALLYEEGEKVGLHLLFISNKAYFSLYTGLPKYLKSRLDTGFIAMKVSEQSAFVRSSSDKEEPLASDEVFLHYQDIQTRIKITK